MVRILPPPTSGTHPLYPDYPEPLPANFVIAGAVVSGVTLGAISSTAFRVLRGRSSVSRFLSHTGRWTLGAGAVASLTQWKRHQEAKAHLNELGIKLRPWTFLQMSQAPTADDYMASGIAAGFLFSVARRALRISPMGPSSRILGSMAVGGFTGIVAYTLLWPKHTAIAMDILEEQKERLFEARLQFYQDKDQKSVLGMAPSSVTQIQYMAPPSPQTPSGSSQTASDEGVVDPVFPNPHPALPPRGSEPHAVALVNGEIRPWPNTDYCWNPGSNDDGIQKLQDHIQLLQETRKELALEAEYLWIVIAEKEHQYYTAEDDSKKIMVRKELELLGDIHSKLFQDISGYDWMIADSKKNILQLKNKKWIPVARSTEVQRHSPERSLKLIRNHLNNIKEVVKASDPNIFTDDTPDDVKEHMEKQQEWLKQNLNATASLMREFEDYVQNGRDYAREEYLKTKTEEEKRE